MFEKIRFKNYSGTLSYEEMEKDPGYQDLLKNNQIMDLGVVEYTIDSRKNCVLLPPPIPEATRDQFLYLQSFNYAESGCRYYTKRKDFYSFLLLFTYEGTGRLNYRGRTYLLEKGDIAIIDCRELHEYQTEGHIWNHGDLHFCGGNSNYLIPMLFGDGHIVSHPACFQAIQNQLETLLRSTDRLEPFESAIELQKLLLLISKVQESEFEEQNRTPENLKYLRLYIEKHFSEELSLDFLAGLAGITKYHLCREYRRHFGYSPKEYILHLRCLQAEILLQSSNLPSYRIAQVVGFSNEANFINYFKKTHQMTPGEYRKLKKTGERSSVVGSYG